LPLLSRGARPPRLPLCLVAHPACVAIATIVFTRIETAQCCAPTASFAVDARSDRAKRCPGRRGQPPLARVKRFDAQRRAELSCQHRLLLATFGTQASQVKHSCDTRERATSLRRRARDVAPGQCNNRGCTPCVNALELGTSKPQQRWQSEAARPFHARHVAERDGPLPRGASAASIPACARAIARPSRRRGGGSYRQHRTTISRRRAERSGTLRNSAR